MVGIKTVKTMLINLNKTIAEATCLSEKVNTGTEAFQRIVTGSAGTCGFAKGSVDVMEDLVCKDFLSLTVDCIEVTCNLLTITTSFISGLNITSVVTIPISNRWEFFRWCFKKSMFNFGCKRELT